MIYLAQVGSFHNVLCSIIVSKQNSFKKDKDMIFFLVHREPLSKKWKIIDSILKHLKIKYRMLYIEPINHLEFSKKRIDSLKNIILNFTSKIDYHITNFNDGLLFNTLRSIYKKKQTFLIDDGYGNILYYKRKNKLIKKIQSIILNIPYDFYPKYNLALNNNYNMFYTALNVEYIKYIKSKCKAIHKETRKMYRNIIDFDKKYFENISYKSCLICTHHSVDSGRLSTKEFERIIIKIKNYFKKELNVKNFYFIKHPAEGNIMNEIYKNHNLILLKKYNAEIYIHSNRFSYCVHPNNSIPLVAESISRTNVKYYSYNLPNTPHINERAKINNIFDVDTVY